MNWIVAVGMRASKLLDKVVEIKSKAALEAALGNHTFGCGLSAIRNSLRRRGRAPAPGCR